MKFFLPVALLAAAVSAQNAEDCDAANIVEACLTSETAKMDACGPADYDCQCYAAQAIATCYNNCPNDTRKTGADGEVTIYCNNASIHGDKATQVPKSGSGAPKETAEPTATDDEAETTSTGDAATSETSPGGAAERAMNAGAVLLAVAGAMAVVV